MSQNVLFVGRGTHLTCGAGHQARAILENQAELERSGFAFEIQHAQDSEELVKKATLKPYDHVLLLVPWRDTADDVVRTLERTRAKQKGKLTLIDYTDQTCSPHWAALPLVDSFLKPYLLTPLRNYENDYAGGYIFTDFLKRKLDYDLMDWHFSSHLDQKYADRIHLGWNLCGLDRYHQIAKIGNRFTLPFALRPIDLNVRFTVGKYQGKSAWYTKYRATARDIVKSIKGKRISGEGRLPFKRYLLDLSLSKIVVSPFGWGEVCFRDYEAVSCGSLLIKPSMEHLITEPNIFIPNKTYVPVRWDLSDLKEKCDYYLQHPQEAQAIIRNAYDTYRLFFKEKRIVNKLTELLRQ